MLDIVKELRLYQKVYNTTINEDGIGKAVELFDKQGHSGFTANYVISHLKNLITKEEETTNILNDLVDRCKDKESQNYLMQKLINSNIFEMFEAIKELSHTEKILTLKLMNHQPLTPLLGTDDEWEDTSGWGVNPYEEKTYQNKRCSSVFKTVFKNGLTICYKIDDNIYSDNGGVNFFSTGRFGKKEITFPYTVRDTPEKVYIYEPNDEDGATYILTNKETIEKLKEMNM